MTWARDCVDAFGGLSTGREYPNFPGFIEHRERTLRAAHGKANYARLRELSEQLEHQSGDLVGVVRIGDQAEVIRPLDAQVGGDR